MELIDRDEVLDDMLYVMCGTGYQSEAMSVIKMADEIDPIHAMGACYCHECKFKHTDSCPAWYEDRPTYRDTWMIDEDYGFCSYGKKEEE